MSDDDLRDILARAAREHTPDQARIRERFERGRTEHLRRRQGRPGGPFAQRGPADVVPLRPPSRTPARGRGWVLPTTWGVAAACAVTAFAVGTGARPGGGPDVRPATRAAAVDTDAPEPPSTTRPLPPTTTPALPEAVVTSPDGTSGRGSGGTSATSAPTRSPGPVTTGAGVSGPDRCDDGARLVDGPYIVANNQWNSRAGTGRQCVRLSKGQPGATGWTATWTWTGAAGTVKAYPSVVRGWHWGWGVPDAEFPVPLDPRRSVRTTWAYRVEGAAPGLLDVSTIFTLHRGAPSGPSDIPDAEVRVVLSTFGPAVPPKEPVLGTVDLPGAGNFAVTRNGPVWTLTSTRARDRREVAASLDLLAVGRQLQPLGLDPTLVVSGVVAGADVRTGTARLVTTAYRVTVR